MKSSTTLGNARQVIFALRCSSSVKSECDHETCPNVLKERVTQDLPIKPDITEDGVGYLIYCDCDRICQDAALLLERATGDEGTIFLKRDEAEAAMERSIHGKEKME